MAGETPRIVRPGIEDDEQPAPPKKKEPEIIKVFKLRKKIMVYGEELEEIKFREPTSKDIMTHGYPIIMRPISGGGLQIVTDEEKMGAMIGALTVMPPSSVGQLHPRDWATISAWLTSFFVPDWDKLLDDPIKT
jgi:hypothetical protein